MNFELTSAYKPTGDQPEAIAQLTDGVIQGLPAQTLLGVTGSGKTFTIANVINEINRPTLVLSHNKTLAAQLYSEFKNFFPENAVEYFYGYMATHADFLRLSLSSCITVAAILYIVTLLLWLGKVFLRYFNMDIRIDREQLFFESGLLSRNSSRFSYDKICTVYIKRNIIEKWLACSTVMLKQALNATDRNRGADVRIYGSDSATTFLDWWLGKDYASSQPIVSAQSGYGLLGYTIRFDLLVSLAAGIALCYFQYYGWLWLPVVYMLISLIKGIFAVRRSSITLKEDYVEINSGKFAEVKNYFKYSNMEVVRMTATPFTPFYHRVNLVISTNGSSFTIRSLKEQEAKEIYELLLYNCYIK